MTSEKNILLADAESFSRTLLKLSLKSEGYLAIEADNISALSSKLETMRGVQVGLLVLDSHLPGGCVVRFLEEVRQKSITIPAICMTRYYDYQLADNLLSISGVSALEKPFTEEDFLDSVRHLYGAQDRKQELVSDIC